MYTQSRRVTGMIGRNVFPLRPSNGRTRLRLVLISDNRTVTLDEIKNYDHRPTPDWL